MLNPVVFTESVQLGGSAATLYTSPAQVTSIVKKCTLANTDVTNGHAVTIYVVASGGAVGATNILIDARTIGPKQTLDITEMVNQILNPGDFISAFADTGAEVNIRVSGVQFA
jgi:hypothetical protein